MSNVGTYFRVSFIYPCKSNGLLHLQMDRQEKEAVAVLKNPQSRAGGFCEQPLEHMVVTL